MLLYKFITKPNKNILEFLHKTAFFWHPGEGSVSNVTSTIELHSGCFDWPQDIKGAITITSNPAPSQKQKRPKELPNTNP